MYSGFRFGEKATWDFHMHVQHSPPQNIPLRRMQTFSVLGRNGNLHIQDHSFDNYSQPYDCYFHNPDKPTPSQAHAIKSWLGASGLYQRLEDTYDPEHFRLAVFAGPLDIENRLNRYGICTVYFDCDPRAFLKSGELPLSFSTPGEIHNPTNFPSLPLITVTGTDAGTVTIGSYTVVIRAIDSPIILDCELQHAYSQPGEGAPENRNSDILAQPFPRLNPGTNLISFAGGITGVEIVPRWWEL